MPSVPFVRLGHPSGNQFFRHLTRALRDAGMLAKVCTAIDWRGGGAWEKVLPPGVRRELARRNFSTELGVAVAQHPWRELARLTAGRLGWTWLVRHETGVFSIDAVYRDFDDWTARQLSEASEAGVVYAYEDAAEATFRAATKLGWKKAYDLPIAYWETSRRLLEEEAQRWPSWEPTLIGTRDSAAKLERKTRELSMADLVVVPSRFVAESLPAATREGQRVVIAPFGSPPVVGGASAPAMRSAGEPLRVLFAGALSQRKGLADLFAAIRLLARRDVQLVVMGTPVADLAFYRRELSDFVYEPPRPHEDVLALMRTCDVFCLPSIVEGRALVVQEALSCGLPAIITRNTGADDVVEDGVNGFVVPIRAPAIIAEKIAWFAEHRETLPRWSAAACAAAARFTWKNYGATIVHAVQELRAMPHPCLGSTRAAD